MQLLYSSGAMNALKKGKRVQCGQQLAKKDADADSCHNVDHSSRHTQVNRNESINLKRSLRSWMRRIRHTEISKKIKRNYKVWRPS